MGRFRSRSATAAAAAAAAIVVVSPSAQGAPVVSSGAAAAIGAFSRAGEEDDGAAGGAVGGRSHRRLLNEEEEGDGEYRSFGGYRPVTDVTNWALLDRDQRSFESQLKLGTRESFSAAKSIYLHGGHSFSYAVVDIDPPLVKGVRYDTEKTVSGLTIGGARGKNVKGTLVGRYWGGEASVSVLYQVPKDVGGEVRKGRMCMIGGLREAGEEMTKGCYNETGTLSIGGNTYEYRYDAVEDTYGHVSLSTINKMAMREMYKISLECLGCPYPEFVQYQQYYDDMSYGHRWVEAALDGKKVEYQGRGDADFTDMSMKGRADAAKKGSVYLNVFMYVLRNMRLAVSDCTHRRGDYSVALESWDTAAALYVGSLERRTVHESPAEKADATEKGEFLYDLAESRCREFATCGRDSDSSRGPSSVNLRILAEFAEGQKRIAAGKCNRAESHLNNIWDLMTIPLIQSALKYARSMDERTNPSKEKTSTEMNEKRNAEGATFAAAILPRIWGCNQEDADVLYESMKVGATDTDFGIVKRAFEANYDCLGLTCKDVGGLFDVDTDTYLEGAEPCGTSSSAETSSAGTSVGGAAAAGASGATAKATGPGEPNKAIKVVGGLVGALMAILGLCCGVGLYHRQKKEAKANSTPASDGVERFPFHFDKKEEKNDGMADITII